MTEEKSDGYERLADIAHAAKKEGVEVSQILRDVVRDYSNVGADISDFYEKNVKKLPETVHLKIEEMYRASQSLKEDVTEVVKAMRDISAPEPISAYHMPKIFANSCFLILVASFSIFFGSYVMAPVLGFIFLKFGAVLLVIFVIPISSTFIYRNLRVRSLAEKRIYCALMVFVQNILIGFINQKKWLEADPYCVTVQIVCSFAYPLFLAHNEDRQKIFLAISGISISFQILQGFFIALNVQYVTISIIYTFLAVLLIQYSIVYRIQTDFDVLYTSMQYVFGISIIKMFILLEMGTENLK